MARRRRPLGRIVPELPAALCRPAVTGVRSGPASVDRPGVLAYPTAGIQPLGGWPRESMHIELAHTEDCEEDERPRS
jgi:hypothetical protein